MKPEDLKRIAEYMGYTWGKSTQNNYDICIGGIVYNPLTNPEQLLELIEKLFDIGFKFKKVDGVYTITVALGWNSHSYTGKTLAEAVIKAVLEMIRGEE